MSEGGRMRVCVCERERERERERKRERDRERAEGGRKIERMGVTHKHNESERKKSLPISV